MRSRVARGSGVAQPGAEKAHPHLDGVGGAASSAQLSAAPNGAFQNSGSPGRSGPQGPT